MPFNLESLKVFIYENDNWPLGCLRLYHVEFEGIIIGPLPGVFKGVSVY